MKSIVIPAVFLLKLACVTTNCLSADDPTANLPEWKMHTIDRSSTGADGVRLGDVDRDGRLDIATGWEEGGQIRIAFQPQLSEVATPWPSVVVGKVKSPEDAVFIDVDQDGWLDVVSCCEGKQQTVFVHLNPGTPEQVRNPSAWVTEPFLITNQHSRWMFCQPLNERQLVLGSKDPNGQICLLDSGVKPAVARLQKLRTAGWIMSLRTFDIDRDGDMDIVYSDRKGANSGVGWLENSGNDKWTDHQIGGAGMEVMFLDIAIVDQQIMIACNTRNQQIMLMTPRENVTQAWYVRRIAHPVNSGAGKAVAIGDLNGDGQFDLACTCGLAADKFGVYWLSDPGKTAETDKPQRWQFHDISGLKTGEKFDRIELLDIDHDGDLDLLTCEERDNLGVVWYENPLMSGGQLPSR